MAETGIEAVIEQLEDYRTNTRAQIAQQPEQEYYWRGVLFGLDLALLEARKQVASAQPGPALPATFLDDVNRLVFNHLENLITLCRSPIKRDLLLYNAQVARYELLQAIPQQAGEAAPSDYEWQARPGIEGSDG